MKKVRAMSWIYANNHTHRVFLSCCSDYESKIRIFARGTVGSTEYRPTCGFGHPHFLSHPVHRHWLLRSKLLPRQKPRMQILNMGFPAGLIKALLHGSSYHKLQNLQEGGREFRLRLSRRHREEFHPQRQYLHFPERLLWSYSWKLTKIV